MRTKLVVVALLALNGCTMRLPEGPLPATESVVLGEATASTATGAIVAQASAAAAAQREARDCHQSHVDRIEAFDRPQTVMDLVSLAAGQEGAGWALCPMLAEWAIDEIEFHSDPQKGK